MAFVDELIASFRRERVELPDGKELYLREVSGVEIEKLADKKGLVANIVNILIVCATDKEGRPLFKPEDEEKLKNLPWPVLRKCHEISKKLNEPEDSQKN